MEQLRTLWFSLDPRRRLIAAGVALAVFAGVIGLARLAGTPGMALLYAGLEGPRAGEVIQALDQRGLRYEVRGDAVYVEARLRDETRMALAGQGLPAGSAAGYELLDGLTGFGTTSQMFDAAYWRAIEGELARTITASPHVRAARVHVSHDMAQPFRRERRVSASVTVTPAGAALSPAQGRALRFLVASAVAGLNPDDVSVIDAAGGLVVAEDTTPAGTGGDRAAELRRNVERLVEAHVGAGRAVVEVSVETVTDRETIVERRIEPDSRIAVRQESEERNATASDARPGGVGVASNLPDGDAAGGDGRSDSREMQSRQRIDYELSRTSREIERGPGAIRRLSVAVLIDGVRVPDGNGGTEWRPRPEAEIEALRELVASAVGFDAARGDVITLRSLPFETLAAPGGGVAAGWSFWSGLDAMGLIRLAVLALVVTILALFVLRPLLRNTGAARRGDDAALPPLPGIPAPLAPGLDGDIDTPWNAAPMPVAFGTGEGGGEGGFGGGFGDPAGGDAGDAVERMRRLIAERQDETIEILRNWMEEDEVRR